MPKSYAYLREQEAHDARNQRRNYVAHQLAPLRSVAAFERFKALALPLLLLYHALDGDCQPLYAGGQRAYLPHVFL